MHILDGGLATELERIYKTPISGHPLWSSAILMDTLQKDNRHLLKEDKPLSPGEQALISVHESYLCAGSTVITTCTYQTSLSGCIKSLKDKSDDEEDSTFLEQKAESMFNSLIDRAVFCARKAISNFDKTKLQPTRHTTNKKILIAGSLGPYGASLADGSEYTGSYADFLTIETLIEFHEPRVSRLILNKVDLLLFETIPCLLEAQAIFTLMSHENYAFIPFWISFACQNEERVFHGESIQECIQAVLKHPFCMGVGINCTRPQYVSGLLDRIRACLDHHDDVLGDRRLKMDILCYPNSGELWDDSRKEWIPLSSDRHVSHSCDVSPHWNPCEWIKKGATVVGGCCRTTPRHIELITEAVNSA